MIRYTTLTRAATANVAGLLVGLAFAVATPAMSANHTPIASDGQEIAVGNFAETMRGVPSHPGTGEAPDVSAVSSASEMARLLSLKSAGAPDGVESIIGADNRFQINPTTGFPARAVVLITFSAGRCTGWMIGANTVMTAGHCVSNGNGAFFPTSSYRIFPGRNGTSSPFGSCTAKQLLTVTGWHNSGNENFDYGAIKLNCSIGNTVGTFGFWWQSASMTGLFSRVSGYPGDKPLTQWQSTDFIRVTETNKLFYQNDTVGGNSGGPVWQNRGVGSAFCSGVCAMAIHTNGLHGAPPHSTNNHGTRIRQAVFNNMIAWRNAP